MKGWASISILLIALGSTGCEGDDDDGDGTVDSGKADTGRADTGVDSGVDTGVDSGVVDTGTAEDSGVVEDSGADAGSSDSGTVEAEPTVVAISAAGHDRLLGATHDSTGRIYVAGFASDSTIAPDYEMLVGRLLADGTPDPSFGTAGFTRVNVAVAGNGEVGRGIVVQSDGRIVISGTVEAEGAADARDRDIALVRFDDDGTLDTTFGDDGIAILDLSTGEPAGNGFSADNTWGLNVFADDDLLIVGARKADGRTDLDFAAVRLTPDGAYDDTFGTNGVFSLDIGNNGASPRSGTVLADGTVVIAGYMSAAGVVMPVLYKLDSAGALDPSFGVNGVYTEAVLADTTEAYGAALQGTDFVTGGYGRETANDSLDFVSIRVSAGGVRDTTYGQGGVTRIDVTGFNDQCRGVTVLPDGRVLLIGGGRTSMTNSDAMIAILGMDGQPDTSFGPEGYRLYDLGAATDFFWGMSLAPEGSHLAVVGTRQVAADTNEDDDSAILILPLD